MSFSIIRDILNLVNGVISLTPVTYFRYLTNHNLYLKRACALNLQSLILNLPTRLMNPVPSVSFSQTIDLIFWPKNVNTYQTTTARFKVYGSMPGLG